MSRKLDALVAEKVMGYPKEFNALAVPHFSTDISAAWQVVEKLRGEHRRVEVVHDGGWVCMLWDGDEVTDHCSVDAEAATAPLAICLAALKAVGIEYNLTNLVSHT